MENKTGKKITVTEALSNLKLIDKKIEKQLSTLQKHDLIGIRVGGQKDTYGRTQEDIKKSAESKITSIIDLITNRKALKAKIAQSNAITIVYINNKKFTVAEAIEFKNSISYDERLNGILNRSYASALSEYEEKQEEATERVSSLLNAKMGSDKNTNTEALAKELKSIYEPTLINPLNIEKIAEERSKEIDGFLQNVDVALSVSNATTFID